MRPNSLAIRELGSNVPTLCFDERQAPFGACRVCLVGAAGARGPIPSCTTPCREGLEIDTQDETARRVASAVVELVLSELPEAPAEHTELAVIARMLGVDTQRWPGPTHAVAHDGVGLGRVGADHDRRVGGVEVAE